MAKSYNKIKLENFNQIKMYCTHKNK